MWAASTGLEMETPGFESWVFIETQQIIRKIDRYRVKINRFSLRIDSYFVLNLVRYGWNTIQRLAFCQGIRQLDNCRFSFAADEDINIGVYDCLFGQEGRMNSSPDNGNRTILGFDVLSELQSVTYLQTTHATDANKNRIANIESLIVFEAHVKNLHLIPSVLEGTGDMH